MRMIVNSPAEFIKLWNMLYPLDKYIREKYKIRFGSPEHRQVNYIDALYEFLEDRESRRKGENQFTADEDAFMATQIPNSNTTGENQGPQVLKMTKAEIDRDFENLDIHQF